MIVTAPLKTTLLVGIKHRRASASRLNSHAHPKFGFSALAFSMVVLFTMGRSPCVLAQTSISGVGIGGGGALFCPAVSPHDRNLMFVACDMGGLYRSNDGGKRWSLLDQRRVKGSSRFSVAFDPTKPGRVIGFHSAQKLMESRDGGVTWAQFQPALPRFYDADRLSPEQPEQPVVVTAAAFSPEPTARLLIGTTKGVFRFESGRWQHTLTGSDQPVTDTVGNQIAKVNTADVIKFVFVKDPTTRAVLDFVATVSDVYQWNPQTRAWNAFGPATSVRPLGPFHAYPDWNVTPPQYIASRIRGLAGGGDASRYVLYVTVLTDKAGIAHQGGVYRYEKTATNTPAWTRQVNGLNLSTGDQGGNTDAPRYEHLGVADGEPDTAYVTVVNNTYSPNVYKGTFAGGHMTWRGVYNGFQNNTANNLNPGWIEKEPPHGLGWGFGGAAKGFAVDPRNANTAILTNNAAIHITRNGAGATSPSGNAGKDWTQSYTHLVSGVTGSGRWQSTGLQVTTSYAYVAHPHPAKANLHFICNSDIGLSRSHDDGTSWASVARTSAGASWYNWYELAFEHPSGGRIWAAVSNQHDIPHETQHARAPGKGAVLASDNDGADWFQVSDASLPPGPVVSIVYRAGVLYASVWGQGVYQSASRGQTWAPVGNPLASFPLNRHVYRIMFSPTGVLHCVVAASRRNGFVAGGLYAFSSAGGWQKLTDGLEQLLQRLSSDFAKPAKLAPTDFAFDPARPGVIYLCTADVTGSNGGGGVYRFDGRGVWAKYNISFPPYYSDGVHNITQAFAPLVLGNVLYVTTTTHGIWYTKDSDNPTNSGNWTEFVAIPFLGAQRLSVVGQRLYITTFGGGVWKVE